MYKALKHRGTQVLRALHRLQKETANSAKYSIRLQEFVSWRTPGAQTVHFYLTVLNEVFFHELGWGTFCSHKLSIQTFCRISPLVRVCHLLASPHLPCFWCDWWTDSSPVAFSRSSSLYWPLPYPSPPTVSFPGPTVLIYSASSHMEALPYFPWGWPFFPLSFLVFLHLRSVQWDYLNVKNASPFWILCIFLNYPQAYI